MLLKEEMEETLSLGLISLEEVRSLLHHDLLTPPTHRLLKAAEEETKTLKEKEMSRKERRSNTEKRARLEITRKQTRKKLIPTATSIGLK